MFRLSFGPDICAAISLDVELCVGYGSELLTHRLHVRMNLDRHQQPFRC